MFMEPEEDDQGREPFMRPAPGPQTPTTARVGRPPSMDQITADLSANVRGLGGGGGPQPAPENGRIDPTAVKEGIPFLRAGGIGPNRMPAVQDAVARAPMPGPAQPPSSSDWMGRLRQSVSGALGAPPEYRPRPRPRKRRLRGTGGTGPGAPASY